MMQEINSTFLASLVTTFLSVSSSLSAVMTCLTTRSDLAGSPIGFDNSIMALEKHTYLHIGTTCEAIERYRTYVMKHKVSLPF